jgi:hypothetical protein
VVLALMGGGPAGEPNEYHGIQMRSKLESDFARHLDRLGVKWTYEPRVFDGYLPDFQLALGDRPCFAEVKPTLLQAEAAKERMTPIWKTHPDAFLLVVCAEKSTFFGANRGEGWTSWTDRWAHS